MFAPPPRRPVPALVWVPPPTSGYGDGVFREPECQTELPRGALARQWVAQPRLQLALRPSDEAFMLLEKDSEPRVVMLGEVVRNHDRPCHAIAEQIGGQQGPGVSGAPDPLRWYFA